MSNLSFTATKKAAPVKPAGPYRHPDFDYFRFAVHTRDEIRAQLELIAEESASGRQLRERVNNGRRWLATHTETHPRHAHNSELLQRLLWLLDLERWAVRDAKARLLDLCIAFWSAVETLTPIERAALGDLQDIPPADVDADHRAQSNWQDRKDI